MHEAQDKHEPAPEYLVLPRQALGRDLPDNPTLFSACEETRLLRLVGQHEQGQHPDDDGWDRLHNVHDLPALKAEQTVETKQSCRDRSAESDRNGQAHEKSRHDARMVLTREPIGEVE